MSAPGSLDLSRHYASGLSDIERKMLSVVGHEDDDSAMDDEEEDCNSTPLLSTLPTELVDRILHHIIFDTSCSSTSTSSSFNLRQRLDAACKVCLVCRQFDQLARPKMYKQVSISTRQMRSFLQTLEQSPNLARHIREMKLEGRIWTDVDENVVAKILLAVREHCVRIRVGANESPLLPYLLHGDPTSSTTTESPLKVLDICWRDEIEIQSHWQQQQQQLQQHQQDQQQEKQSDSLKRLFHHDVHNESSSISSINLTHITLDLYSQSQLDQVFDSNGYFVKIILPKLQFLRIEMPLVLLQFKCNQPGDLVEGWPKDDWKRSERNIQEAIDDRQDQIRRVAAAATAKTITTSTGNTSLGYLEQHQSGNSEEETERDNIIMPYCPVDQLKSLTLRFLLNVHRNDMTLFKLLIPPKALEQSWSTRASVAAQCLSSTMQNILNSDSTSKSCYFPFAVYKSKGPEVYWNQKWIEAEADYNSTLPFELRAPSPSEEQIIPQETTRVSLLLKWPNAVDAFFHYSAMI